MSSLVLDKRRALPHPCTCVVSLLWILWCWVRLGALTEGLGTIMTLIGLFPSVCPFILAEWWAVAEGFPTFIVLKRLFLGVNPLVFHEKGTLAEGTTFTTFIELLSCVAPPMLNEGSKLAFHRAFPQYELSCGWRPCHSHCIHRAFLLCGFSDAESVVWCGWRLSPTHSSHRASLQCGFDGVWSGMSYGSRLCHIPNDRASRQCGL